MFQGGDLSARCEQHSGDLVKLVTRPAEVAGETAKVAAKAAATARKSTAITATWLKS